MRRRLDGRNSLLISKLTDELLVAGNETEIHRFKDEIGERFTISKIVTSREVKFNATFCNHIWR